jgi:acetyl-CoA C-acetyltransferase
MRRAVVVSTARTGLAKSFRGGFNMTHGAALAGHCIEHAVARAGLAAAASCIEDVFLGCGMPEGETGMNVARNAAMWAGLPNTVSGATINRFCSSGLQGIANAAHSIIVDGATAAIGGGEKLLEEGGFGLHSYVLTSHVSQASIPSPSCSPR